MKRMLIAAVMLAGIAAAAGTDRRADHGAARSGFTRGRPPDDVVLLHGEVGLSGRVPRPVSAQSLSGPQGAARCRTLRSIRTFTPTYHGDGRADWTFAVELHSSDAGATGAPTEQEIIKKLYPDQAKFRKEEQRRFELLEAHWDVPLNAVDFESRSPSR